jgi:hypothetical protein
MTSVLDDFGLSEMLRCSLGLREAMRQGETMESAARECCRFLYDELVTEGGAPACALVRCYKTHRYQALDRDLQAVGRRLLPPGTVPTVTLRCLTLLGTAGVEKAWNDRRRSSGHQAIPLPTAAVVEQAPMVAQLIRALGLDIATAIAPRGEIVRDLAGKTYGVFHVAEAKGSTYIPAQDFVVRYGIRSVVGFGGVLPSGDLFAVILFARVPVSAGSADRFRTLALDVKGCLVRYSESQIFD